jgi:putative DNA primase/helicase
VQEWFGYSLLPDTRQQKMLLLVGPKRSGKGTIGRVLKGLVGEKNVAGPTLSSLATSFGLSPLLGKTVAVISDARLSGRTDANVITERLLAISGEDWLTVDRKHLPAVDVKLPTRFVILTNELPRMNDASGALAGRLLLLRLTKSFYGKEDPALTARLLDELPGILLWAVEGWRRLQDRKHFLQPESGRELLGHLEDLASPIGAFIRECCEVGQDQQVAKAELYERWKRWCEQGGREHPGDVATFGRNLVAAVPTVRTSQPREGGKRTPSYVCIGLRRP